MAEFARGQDIEVSVRTDGAPVLPISINSGTWTPGLNMEEVNEAGRDAPIVDGFNGVVALQLDVNPNRAMYDLMDAQREKNAGTRELAIDAEFTIDFGRVTGGGPDFVRYLMPDCVLHEPGTPIPGSTDRLTKTFTLSCSTYRRRA